jgi:hypothetical protein
MKNSIPPLELRVQRTLARYGFPELNFQCLDGGVVELTTKDVEPNSRAFLVAVVRTLPGVTAYKPESKVA